MLSKWRLVLSGLLPGVGIMLVGFACIAMARWSRSRGANALVLLRREEALRAEQERQKVLAANLERNRISAAMQTEVLTTLESVIAQADEGLVMLNAEPALIVCRLQRLLPRLALGGVPHWLVCVSC